MRARDTIPVQLGLAARSLTRPYRVSFGMIALMALVPAYIFIAARVSHRAVEAPAIWLDRALPLVPASALVYGALYLFLILLPVFVVREQEHIRRTFLAYLAVWITAYVIFLTYPTIAPRPDKVIGTGFADWGLRFLYEADPPYNCFPSLHVAHSFVSALTCYAVNRRVGLFATFAASIVALSTLLTKQHYVLDVLAGIALASIAYAVFLRSYRRELVPARDRHIAPALAVSTLAISAIAVGLYWLAYFVSGRG
jgi:membrane-associated phospholipid phosphatase